MFSEFAQGQKQKAFKLRKTKTIKIYIHTFIYQDSLRLQKNRLTIQICLPNFQDSSVFGMN